MHVWAGAKPPDRALRTNEVAGLFSDPLACPRGSVGDDLQLDFPRVIVKNIRRTNRLWKQPGGCRGVGAIVGFGV